MDDIKLSFLGAARNVTGSCYLLEAGGRRILVECGLYQERDFKDRNWEPFPVDPATVDCVLLTHGHLDHCGRLPKLCKEGFKGKIYCTETSVKIAQLVLMDAAHIQEEDAKYKLKRHAKEGRKGPHPVLPLYTMLDVESCVPQFCGVKYNQPVSLCEGVTAEFKDAGHILGSAFIELTLAGKGWERKVLFSGDIGRVNTPILKDPDVLGEADYVLIESTYGDREHKDNSEICNEMASFINQAYDRGGKIMIPSFSVERAQELLFRLYKLRKARAIPLMPVYLDSPMAIHVTKVLKQHEELLDAETLAMLENGEHPFDFKGLKLCATVEESKAINEEKTPSIIIAGSGMCTGGRIKHHLANYIEDPKHLVLFVGYQAAGTLGRLIVDGRKEVRILGQTKQVKAQVARIQGFSAHADRNELLSWIINLKRPPRKVFVVHGEADSADDFARFLRENTGGWEVAVPDYKEQYNLE